MARPTSGAVSRPDGSIFVGDVVLVDPRLQNLRELLSDLSHPGVCIVLGAGASYGLVPLAARAIAELALEIIRAQSKGAVPILTTEQRRIADESLEFQYLLPLLREREPSRWDRFLLENLDRARAVVACSDLFTPRKEIPPALIRIYDVIENAGGSIVSFNYDGVDQRQVRFPVIHPHGQRSEGLVDPNLGPQNRKVALDYGCAPSVNWHLPFPEDSAIQARRGYNEMLRAWRAASSVVLVGYGFGSGIDQYSFEAFGKHVRIGARVHVLCPRPENADLCKQVKSTFREQSRGFRVRGQPFSWRAFAEATLRILEQHGGRQVRHCIGYEPAFLRQHDCR